MGKVKVKSKMQLLASIVLDFMRGYLQKQYHLYVDNFCTSPLLSSSLE